MSESISTFAKKRKRKAVSLKGHLMGYPFRMGFRPTMLVIDDNFAIGKHEVIISGNSL